MDRILIISPAYSQVQYLKEFLEGLTDSYTLCGIADNSVLGMGMLPDLKPEIVIMPLYLPFWNAEDLITSIINKDYCPTFLLLSPSGRGNIDKTASQVISDILPSAYPTKELFTNALAKASAKHMRDKEKKFTRSSTALEHSVRLMQIVLGMASVPEEFSDNDVLQDISDVFNYNPYGFWLIIGSEISDSSTAALFNISSGYDHLIMQLKKVLLPFGKSESCLVNSSLIIVLSTKENIRPDWETILFNINNVFRKMDFPALQYVVSDNPIIPKDLPSEYRSLTEVDKSRFFYSPLVLTKSTLLKYHRIANDTEIHQLLILVSDSIGHKDNTLLGKAMDNLEQAVSKSLSMNLYYDVIAQLLLLYTKYRSADEAPDFLQHNFRFPEARSVSEAFSFFRSLFWSIVSLGEKSVHHPVVEKAMRYIHDNLHLHITLKDVADAIHFNPSYLSRVFSSNVGMSFTDYLNQQRIENAKLLLGSNGLIIDVALASGFDNPKYFSQVFRKYTGMTPMEWKIQRRDKK